MKRSPTPASVSWNRHGQSTSALPVVIEPSGSNTLEALLRLVSESQAIVDQVRQVGAVLLRGFQVDSPQDLDRVVLNLRGGEAMTGYFMAERVRVTKEGATVVFPTSPFIKTGGSFEMAGGFHSENFYTTDVPELQCFHCSRPSRAGGETAFVDMAAVWDALSEGLKERLRAKPLFSRAFAVPAIASRYGLPEDLVRGFLEERGHELGEARGTAWLILRKPVVWRSRFTGKEALLANIHHEIPAFRAKYHRAFAADRYAAPWWGAHRLGWKYRRLETVFTHLDHLPRAFRYPVLFRDFWFRPLKHKIQSLWASQGESPENEWLINTSEEVIEALVSRDERLRYQLTEAELDRLVELMCEHTVVLEWQRGDTLIADNTQLAHSGLPGLGERELLSALWNPMLIETPGSGVYDVPEHASSSTLHDELMTLAAAH